MSVFLNSHDLDPELFADYLEELAKDIRERETGMLNVDFALTARRDEPVSHEVSVEYLPTKGSNLHAKAENFFSDYDRLHEKD